VLLLHFYITTCFDRNRSSSGDSLVLLDSISNIPPYSHTGLELKDTYTGLFFRKVAYIGMTYPVSQSGLTLVTKIK
jgi:hypothetical protein